MPMRRCLAVALILAGVWLPARAQRGGGAHGGFSGGSPGGFHGGFSGGFHAGSPGGFSGYRAPAFSRPAPSAFGRFAARPSGLRAFPSDHSRPGTYSVPAPVRLARPSFYTHRPLPPTHPIRPYPPHRPGYPGYGGVFLYGYPGWFGPGSFGYLGLDGWGYGGLGFGGLGFDSSYCDPALDNCDTGYYGGPGYSNDQGQGFYPDQNDYSEAGPLPPAYGEPGPGGYVQQPDYATPEPYPSYSYQQPAAAAQPQSSPESYGDHDTITLIFKDGRPPEQIHNYALTPTTLYVLRGDRRQDIPVDQIDLAATEKANQDTGVDFQLPRFPNRQTTQPSSQSAAPAAQ